MVVVEDDDDDDDDDEDDDYDEMSWFLIVLHSFCKKQCFSIGFAIF